MIPAFAEILRVGFSTPAKTDFPLCYTSDVLIVAVRSIKGFVFS